ncbi:hypothetical protein EYF80_024045 [Liparis tanakae]|uniref:Uncharacterized protein n=1 Tax=Liparis tanakae TaxID=230148 RepID=A0A4Z2HLT4_9TELE|nr:hypothetical protein EYF80_024045 [Liparis tanakae]
MATGGSSKITISHSKNEEEEAEVSKELILWPQDSMFVHRASRNHRGDVVVSIERVQLDTKTHSVDGQQLYAAIQDTMRKGYGLKHRS